MNKKVFVIGGCRSGKSKYALDLAQDMSADGNVFIATCVPQDEEMRQRVTNHQAQRDQAWKTVEAPLFLPEAIVDNAHAGRVVLVDCLTLWINNLLMKNEDVVHAENQITKLTQAIETVECPLVLVSNEVGTGIVPDNKLARIYRDLVGSANQAVAKSVDSVVMVEADRGYD